MGNSFELHQSGTEVFWGEMPPSEHLVQFYQDDHVFLDTLEGFVSGGLRAGDGVIVIATESHLSNLESRLRARRHDFDGALSSEQYIPLVASDVLDQFMVNRWPDETAFERVVSQLLVRAKGPGRKIRAFGEMVAVLWARGDQGATVRLEYLWHRLCEEHGFSLFCAYPKIGFTGDAAASITELCAVHSRVIPDGTSLINLIRETD